ncbi:hypothetical protein [uncultured Sphingorhabdus sp.]|uniref:hypothetical protein n=1 Tax=uncultured Sphingorhabdus sp. TaxID=1686106 RepID=UPI00260DD002|nr:hypothetical protein [uncultured Sphingorhabdus sp.]
MEGFDAEFARAVVEIGFKPTLSAATGRGYRPGLSQQIAEIAVAMASPKSLTSRVLDPDFYCNRFSIPK